MEHSTLVDPSAPSRVLVRRLRTPLPTEDDLLPESAAWHLYVELRRRDEPGAGTLFMSALKGLHARRSMAGAVLPSKDLLHDEHRMVDDTFLAELWRAYKKSICSNRPQAASLLLQDIEERVMMHE